MGRSDIIPEIAHRVLCASFEQPWNFPHLVDREVTRNHALRSADRRELTEILHDSVRWRRRIWGDIAPSRMDDAYVRERLVEAKSLRHAPPITKWSSLSMDALARELSYPTWLIERWIHNLGLASTISLALSMNEPAPVTLRTNILRIDRKALKDRLAKEDVPTQETRQSPWGLNVTGRRNLRGLRSFKMGFFEIQDEGSQMAVLLSEAKSDQTVVDACTGAGGKALAIAGLLRNSGRILALDADSRPFAELQRRAKRSGVKNIETMWVAADDPDPLPSFKKKADIVLVDAPCSSLGTLRRRPWAKWAISAENADQFPKRQLALLRRFAQVVKPNGRIEYITCTLHAAENEAVVSAFQKEETEFTPLGDPKILRPDTDGCDGFFIARFERLTA
ncbi:MAG TPA: class I SAM-dependent methyltransferase [Bdellovibrionota bacterium]|nr:class I SAM-dependent methyltransferase [Bdellovibrionota bacterium]